jgi:hypothetical protein
VGDSIVLACADGDDVAILLDAQDAMVQDK